MRGIRESETCKGIEKENREGEEFGYYVMQGILKD